MHLDAENTPEEKEIITIIGDHFNVIKNGNNIEITKGEEKFAILCAKPTHPYCSYAESRFAIAAADQDERIELHSVRITIYLRNLKSLATVRASFKADILRKRKGVQSAIITSPPELAGLMCSPSPQEESWTVFRPFKHNFFSVTQDGNPDITALTLSPHIQGFPQIETSPIPNYTKATNLPNLETQNLAPKGIISVDEKTLFKSIRKIYLDEGSSYHTNITPIDGSNNKFLLDTDGAEDIPSSEERVFIFSRSPHQWAEIKDPNDNHFGESQPSSHGYIEFIAGHIVMENGKYYFIAEDAPTSLDGLKAELYRLKNSAQDIRRETTNLIKNI